MIDNNPRTSGGAVTFLPETQGDKKKKKKRRRKKRRSKKCKNKRKAFAVFDREE